MIELRNDYNYIAHPKILKRLLELSEEINDGYGLDKHCFEAKRRILSLLGSCESDVHFLTGGTITNKVFIGHVLKTFEAVIAADTGHINVHETGAIEQTGHKVLTIKNHLAKICGDDILEVLKIHTDEHMVKPKMVYISNPTEYGTIYSKKEIEDISRVCKKENLYLFVDGARLGSALTSKDNDLTLKDLAKLTDAFYIGGTKNGALLGEALVINNPLLNKEFRYSMKNLGGMYAKSFVTGIQFEVLFEDNLFFEIAKKENEMANYLTKRLEENKIQIYIESSTNQVFALFSNDEEKLIKEKVNCETVGYHNNQVIIRFVTNYLTSKEDIDRLIEIVEKIRR